MYEHSDWYRLFTGFWWLIFPIGWMIGQAVRLWMRHQRVQHALDLIKSYADQGKEPPPLLLEALRQPEPGTRAEKMNRPGYMWIPFFLFVGLTFGFVFFAIFGSDRASAADSSVRTPFVFVALIMAGLAAGFLASIVSAHKERKNRDKEQRIPPP